MSKFICGNPECSKFNFGDEYLKNSYKFVDGKLQSNHAPCPVCKSIRQEINPNDDIPLSEKNIDIGKYSSSSPEGRKEILKKRSHDHYEKEIKPLKEHRLRETISNFKKAGKN